MTILTIRTDKPEAEIGLFDGTQQIAYETWPAHRELSATILTKIADMLASQHAELKDVQGIACFKGPGSFTGLRIGLTVGNTLAYSLQIPIVGATGEDWQQEGIQKLLDGENQTSTFPEYGAEAHITQQRK